VDLSSSALVWENPTSAPAPPAPAGEKRFGRQAAVKTKGVPGYVAPTVDPSRRANVSEAPASAPSHAPEEPRSPTPRPPMPRVEAEVHEGKDPLPGVDASRYRAAESPAARFSSESPTAWDEEPKEYE
jgi:hypothetical protein